MQDISEVVISSRSRCHPVRPSLLSVSPMTVYSASGILCRRAGHRCLHCTSAFTLLPPRPTFNPIRMDTGCAASPAETRHAVYTQVIMYLGLLRSWDAPQPLWYQFTQDWRSLTPPTVYARPFTLHFLTSFSYIYGIPSSAVSGTAGYSSIKF